MANHKHYVAQLARALETLREPASPTARTAAPDAGLSPPARLANLPRYAEMVDRVVRHVHASETLESGRR